VHRALQVLKVNRVYQVLLEHQLQSLRCKLVM
jgi:hypothetical protein